MPDLNARIEDQDPDSISFAVCERAQSIRYAPHIELVLGADCSTIEVKEMLMLSGKQYLLALILMALVLVPLSLLVENFHTDIDVTTVGKQELTSELANARTPIYVEVLSRSSVECAENHKVVAELASEYRGKIKFLRVFVEDVPDAESILGVHGTPSGVLITPEPADMHSMGSGTGAQYSPVDGFGSRFRLKQLFDRVP